MAGLTPISLSFFEANGGLQLENIPGYNSVYFPALQMSNGQRLCFFNWPEGQTFSDFEALNTMPVSINVGQSQTYSWDSILGDRNSEKKTATINASYINLMVPVLPIDRILVEDYVNRGAPTEKSNFELLQSLGFDTTNLVASNFTNTKKVNDGTSGGFFSPWTRLAIRSLNGEYYYNRVLNYDMIFLNVQNYIDKFLAVPYSVKALVAYGTSYYNFLSDILHRKNKTQLVDFLSNINFFERPKSEKTFWDKLLQASPVIVLTAFSILTMGAGTPALFAAATGYFGKNALQNYAAAAGKDNLLMEFQNAPPVFDERNITEVTAGNTANKKKLLLLLAIAAAIIVAVQKE